jgi:hypothetical protein
MPLQEFTIAVRMHVEDDDVMEAMTATTKQTAADLYNVAVLLNTSRGKPVVSARTSDMFFDTTEIELLAKDRGTGWEGTEDEPEPS